MADPKWYLAIGESEEFGQHDKQEPWRWALTTEQIAVLQYQCADDDRKGLADRAAWRKALDDSIADGSLRGFESGGKFCGSRASTPEEAALIRPMLSHLGLPPGSEWSTPAQVQTYYTVAARDLARWMQMQDEEPADYVLLWFKKAGVAWPLGLACVANESPTPATLGADDVKDAATLVAYRSQFAGGPPQQQPAWLDSHVAILRDAVKAYGRGGQAEFARRMGCTAARVGQLLKTKSRASQVAPWPAIGGGKAA